MASLKCKEKLCDFPHKKILTKGTIDLQISQKMLKVIRKKLNSIHKLQFTEIANSNPDKLPKFAKHDKSFCRSLLQLLAHCYRHDANMTAQK